MRLAHKIAEYCAFEEEFDVVRYKTLVTEAKSIRDRVAHWPTRLQPLVDPSDTPVDYIPHLEKGNLSFALTSALRDEWLTTNSDSSVITKTIARQIDEYCNSGFE